MGGSRWFLDQNHIFIFFYSFAPMGTTHNFTFLNTQNQPTLLSVTRRIDTIRAKKVLLNPPKNDIFFKANMRNIREGTVFVQET